MKTLPESTQNAVKVFSHMLIPPAFQTGLTAKKNPENDTGKIHFSPLSRNTRQKNERSMDYAENEPKAAA